MPQCLLLSLKAAKCFRPFHCGRFLSCMASIASSSGVEASGGRAQHFLEHVHEHDFGAITRNNHGLSQLCTKNARPLHPLLCQCRTYIRPKAHLDQKCAAVASSPRIHRSCTIQIRPARSSSSCNTTTTGTRHRSHRRECRRPRRRRPPSEIRTSSMASPQSRTERKTQRRSLEPAQKALSRHDGRHTPPS